jgi:hypothetical protein
MKGQYSTFHDFSAFADACLYAKHRPPRSAPWRARECERVKRLMWLRFTVSRKYQALEGLIEHRGTQDVLDLIRLEGRTGADGSPAHIFQDVAQPLIEMKENSE